MPAQTVPLPLSAKACTAELRVKRATVVAERPALRIPVTRAPRARAYPEHATAILIERHDVVISQALRIVSVVSMPPETRRSRIKQVETGRRRDPQSLRIVFENRQDPVVTQRAGHRPDRAESA